MLVIDNLSKKYSSSKGEHHALKNISFSINESKVLALIGESGSGKSTLGEIIMGLQKPTGGSITWFENKLDKKKRVKDIQYIFQNPDRSLNPYWKIEDILLEPLLLNKVRRRDALKEIIEIMEMVELPNDILKRHPRECSGGQQQRIAIARTLTQKPKLLIADEITSSLDPRTELAVIELLNDIKRNINLSILFITHRIHAVKQLADEIIVLKDGEIVEAGIVNAIIHSPKEGYTQRLLRASNYGEQGVSRKHRKEEVS